MTWIALDFPNRSSVMYLMARSTQMNGMLKCWIGMLIVFLFYWTTCLTSTDPRNRHSIRNKHSLRRKSPFVCVEENQPSLFALQLLDAKRSTQALTQCTQKHKDTWTYKTQTDQQFKDQISGWNQPRAQGHKIQTKAFASVWL